MTTNHDALGRLSDGELITEVARLAGRERTAAAELIGALAEFDERRLYLPEGFSSLFAYCTVRLHLSESEAYLRIEAARATRRFPRILALLADGTLTLSAVALLRPHLTEANHVEVLESARHQSKRSIEELVAQLHARPDVRSSVRKLPERREAVMNPGVLCGAAGGEGMEPLQPGPGTDAAATAVATMGGGANAFVSGGKQAPGADGKSGVVAEIEAVPATLVAPVAAAAVAVRAPAQVLSSRPAVVRATAPSRYQVQMTISAETHAKLRRAQDLIRHVVPNGDVAVIFDRALTLLVEDLERKKFSAKKEPRAVAPIERKQKRSRGRRGAPKAGAAVQDDARAAEGRGVGEAGSESARVEPPSELPSVDVPVRDNVFGGGARGEGTRGAPPIRRSRRIPAAVRREVWTRDEGQCAFRGAAGRCPERGFLEFHHEVPFAVGGEATVANTSLRCRRHNGYEAERYFGSGARTIPAPTELRPDGVRARDRDG